MDVKENLAKNLIKYRKSKNLTQAELAEKLNYSDKAVSKWERGESFPDLSVLKQIADFYGVSVDTLLSDPSSTEIKPQKEKTRARRTILCLCCLGLVFLVAICSFAFIDILFPSIEETWLSFIYALPVASVILLVFSCKWKKRAFTAIFISTLVWTVILSVYLTLNTVLTAPPSKLWEIFLIGAVLQVLVVFWSIYKKVKIKKTER